MALNLDQFNAKVDSMFTRLPQAMERVNILMAQSAIPLITQRLTNEGKTAEGKSLGKYSDKPISALFFIGRGLGSGADERVKNYASKNKGKISYEKVRELNSRPTNHVTLSFSGETLADIGILNTSIQGLRVKTIVGSRDRKHKDIVNKKGKKIGEKTTGQVLEELDRKYGSALDTELLDLSPKEEKIIVSIYENRLQKFINEFLAE